MKRPLLLLFFLTALIIFFLYPRDYEPDAIFPQGQYYTVTVRGRLLTYEEKAAGLSLTLEDCRIDHSDNSYHCSRLLVTAEATPPLQVGNQVKVTGSLSSFQPARNPGNFDWRSYYLARHISYRVYADSVTVTDPHVALIPQSLLRLRQFLWDCLQELCRKTPDTGALLTALLLGDKTALEEDIRAKYEDGGILHILTVSGMHMSILGGAVVALIKKPGFPEWLQGICSSLLVILYWQLCGASLSAGRAVVMFLCLTAAPLFGRTYDSLSALALAGTWILWDSPLMLFQAGFQLSFGAILGMQLVSPAFVACLKSPKELPISQKEKSHPSLTKKIFDTLRHSLLFGIGLQMALLPITLYHFFRYPLYSLLLNLLVVPLTTPLFLLSAASLLLTAIRMIPEIAGAALLRNLLSAFSHWLLLPCQWILELYEWLCELSLTLPEASSLWGRPASWRLLLYYGGLLLFCRRLLREKATVPPEHTHMRAHFPRPSSHSPLRSSLPTLLIPLLLLAVLLLPLPTDALTVTFLDVGQGDCALLETPTGTTILIDSGSTDIKAVDEYRLTPFLEAKAIDHLDYVFFSHADEDHVNGVTAWLEQGGIIGTAILPHLPERLSSKDSYQKLLSLLEHHQIPILTFHRGMTWQEEDLTITCLAPVAPDDPAADRYSDLNTASQVLLVQYQDVRILFTGDCEEEGEELLLKTLTEAQITCHILKAGHHGSAGATGTSLLRQLQPQLVVISCGIRNRYGHPHPDTLARIDQEDSLCCITASCGAVTVQIRRGQARIHSHLTPGPLYYR